MSDESFVTPPEGSPPEPPSAPPPAYQSSDAAGPMPPPRQPDPAWTQPPQGAAGPAWITPPAQPRATWAGDTAPQGMPTWAKALVIVGVVVLILAIVMAWGCYSCARGCQKVVETIREGTYTISHDGETRWLWQGDPQPRDTAPPDATMDAEVTAGAERIKAAVEDYRSATGVYPDDGSTDDETNATTSPRGIVDAAASLEERLRPYMAASWPTNPWTGQPMADSPHRGDYVYVLWDDGTYTLRVFLSTGEKDF
jgi:hypothetical protein